MPTMLIVTCAGCGKRYKGTPGSTKYRCASCNNTLTFPRMPRAALPGKALCSNCWRGTDSSPELTVCPACKQRIGTRVGGRATLPGLFASAADPLPFDDQDEQLISTARDLGGRIVAAQVAAMLSDRAVPPENNEACEAPRPAGTQYQVQTAGAGNGASECRNEPLVHYDRARQAEDPWRTVPGEGPAASASCQDRTASGGRGDSGPHHEELARQEEAPQAHAQPAGTSGDAIAEQGAAPSRFEGATKTSDELQALVMQLQAEKAALQRQLDYLRETAVKTLEPLCEEYARRMRDVLGDADRIRTFIAHVRQDVIRRLEATESAVSELRSQVASTGQEMNERLAKVIGTEPPKVEIVPVPAFASSGPFKEVLAAGIPPGTAVTVARHAPKDDHAHSPAA